MANALDKMGNVECDVSHFCVIAVPVLDSDDRMAGIVTVDDVLAHYLPQIIKIKRR